MGAFGEEGNLRSNLFSIMAVTPEHIEKAKAIARDYRATRLVLFGRAAHDPEAARDLDLAIGGVPGWTVWELAGRLERELDVPLDVVPLDPETPFVKHIERTGREVRLDG